MFNYMNPNKTVKYECLTYKKASSLLQGKTQRKLEYETYLIRSGKEFKVRLHETDIIIFRSGGRMILNSGGWKTQLTKDRLNRYSGLHIYQDKGEWYLPDSSIFYDGMVIKRDGTPARPKYKNKSAERIKKQINAYCRELKKLKTLPAPSQGDCWNCLFFDAELEPGEKSRTPDHLKTHLKEKYIHGSIILNALASAGYARPDFIVHMDVRESIVNAVRRYFKKSLGLPC